MGVGVPAGDKSVMGICLVEIFRVRKADQVGSNPVKQQSVFSTLMQKTYAARPL